MPLLDIHLEEVIIKKDTYTPVFAAALFTITRTWRQPGCPSTDEWIIFTIKKNTSESVLMRWMNLKPIIQREVSRKEKDTS